MVTQFVFIKIYQKNKRSTNTFLCGNANKEITNELKSPYKFVSLILIQNFRQSKTFLVLHRHQ